MWIIIGIILGIITIGLLKITHVKEYTRKWVNENLKEAVLTAEYDMIIPIWLLLIIIIVSLIPVLNVMLFIVFLIFYTIHSIINPQTFVDDVISVFSIKKCITNNKILKFIQKVLTYKV